MPGAAILVADSSTVTFMGVVGVMVPPAPGPSLGGGSPVPQWDRCWGRGCDFWLSCLLLLCSGCCQLMAIWHLALLQPPLSYCSPSQAKLGMLCYVLPISPSKKKTLLLGVLACSWCLQAPSHQKASPPFPCTGTALRKVAGAGFFPLRGAPGSGWLCYGQGCSQGRNPPCQQL